MNFPIFQYLLKNISIKIVGLKIKWYFIKFKILCRYLLYKYMERNCLQFLVSVQSVFDYCHLKSVAIKIFRIQETIKFYLNNF